MLVSISDHIGRNKSLHSKGLTIYADQHRSTLEAAMNTCTLPTVIPLQRPWPSRWRDAAVEAWQRWLERRGAARCARLADDLDPRLLADSAAVAAPVRPARTTRRAR
jgi:hypothetical protein